MEGQQGAKKRIVPFRSSDTDLLRQAAAEETIKQAGSDLL